MTTKDFPLTLWPRIRRQWWGAAYYDAFIANGEQHDGLVEVPANRLADRDGGYLIDPDDDTKRWEWDTDLTAQEEADFDVILDRALAGGGTGMPSDAAIDALISTMRSFKNRAGDPTDAQVWTTMDAIIDYLRYLRRLIRE